MAVSQIERLGEMSDDSTLLNVPHLNGAASSAYPRFHYADRSR
jgi:hypothetical protein